VGKAAFQGCGLTEVAIADCEIGESAFFGCQRLTTVTIGPGCPGLGASAFNSCSALASVTLPSTLRWIGQFAFCRCAALATLAVPKGCELAGNAFLDSPTNVTQI
jgi:hypothetical protein